MKRNLVLYTFIFVMMISALCLSSCEHNTEVISPGFTESPEVSIEPEVTEEIPSPSPSPAQSIDTSPEITPSPSESQPPLKPTQYTDSKFFDFDELNGVILNYDIEGGTYVSIPDTINGVEVKSIGFGAFCGQRLYGIVLPDTVKYINELAFSNTGIVEVDLGNGVEYIGENAFHNYWKNRIMESDEDPATHFKSDGITHINLPNSLKYIGEKAFFKNSIAGITFHEGLEYIGQNAFSDNNLYLVYIPDSVNYIGKDAFSGLTEVMVKLGKGYPTHLSIDNDTITGYIATPLSELVIPSLPGVNKIQKEAFKNYTGITRVIIEPGIEYIGTWAFEAVNRLDPKRTVTLPDTIKYVGPHAFSLNNSDTFDNVNPNQLNIVDLTDRSASNPLYNFPQSRNEIITADITAEQVFEDINPVEEWVQRYICTKNKYKDILSINIYNPSSPEENDFSDILLCDNFILKADIYNISIKTSIDIEGMTRRETGFYYFDVQAILAEDKINGQLKLCGFLNQQEFIATKRDLYDYINADGRFILNEVMLSKKLSQIKSAVNIKDLSVCPVIMELTKDAVYNQELFIGYEKYLPVDKDSVIFYVGDPVNKLFRVNYITNEIVWEKSYEKILAGGLLYANRFSDEQNEVFEFKYYIDDYVYKIDLIDTDGKVIAADASESYQEDYISGTAWKVISDNGKIFLEDTNTQRKYLIAHHTESTFIRYSKSKFVKALNSSQFIIESFFTGEGLRYNWYFIYDIDTGNLSLMFSDHYYCLVINKDDEYVTKILNDIYFGDTLYIYNSDDNSMEDLHDWTDYYVCVNQHAESKDGRYIALLTADCYEKDFMKKQYENNGIIIIDLEQRRVLVQDELTLSHGSLTFLNDNTLVINDKKTMMYIDIPSIE
jgi:hypothetical protein